MRQLPATPSDLAGGFLLAFEGDLDETDEARLTAHPYAVVLGLPETPVKSAVSGGTFYRAVIDVVTEHRPIDGKRPSRRPITELRALVLTLPEFVDELAFGVPLARPLRYIGGIRPEPKYQDPLTLTSTCRFDTAWRF